MWEYRFETPEEALRAAEEVRSQCARLTRRLDYLQVKSTAMTSRLSGLPGSGGYQRSDLWEQLADTRSDLTKQLQNALALERELSQWIDLLPRVGWRMVLRYRYLDAMSCPEICDEMEKITRRPCSRSQLYRLQKGALEAAARLWPLKPPESFHADAPTG